MLGNLSFSQTLINMALLGLAGYAAWILAGHSTSLQKVREGMGFKLIIAGLTIFTVFYLTSLIFMFVLPLFVEAERVESLMAYPNLIMGSFVSILGTVWMLIGILLTIKAVFSLVGELEASKTALTQELTERETEEIRLRDATQRATAENRAKSVLLSNVSHELRTPLNAIIGFSDIIRTEAYGPIGNSKYHEYVDDINESGRHLLDLINDILDLSKIEAGQMELQEEAFEIRTVTRSVYALIKESAQSKGVTIEIEVPEDLPYLLGDERRVKQIILNLLSNAVKFTSSGGWVTVKVWCSPQAGHVIQVSDTGIGIAPEDVPTALAAFGQVSAGMNRNHEGTGLGLPLTKSLTEMHGGSLNIESEVDVGTTVTVRFPSHRVISLPEAKALA